METYTAHATMRSGIAQQVRVTATDAIDARRQMFRMNRAIASLTQPRLAGVVNRSEPISEFFRRAGDEVKS